MSSHDFIVSLACVRSRTWKRDTSGKRIHSLNCRDPSSEDIYFNPLSPPLKIRHVICQIKGKYLDRSVFASTDDKPLLRVIIVIF